MLLCRWRTLYQPSRNQKMRCLACSRVAKCFRESSSASSVPKNDSHIALSYASPAVPIDGCTPASRQRRPNAMDVYWADSTGRRNTFDRGGVYGTTSGMDV